MAIEGTALQVTKYKGKRVVTLSMIDEVHDRPAGTAKRNFNEHREKLEEGKHYFRVTGDEIRTQLIGVFGVRASEGILITEKGYMKLVPTLYVVTTQSRSATLRSNRMLKAGIV